MAREVKEYLERRAFPEYETKFVQTFEVGAPAPPCAPYGGEYREGRPRTAIMLEVSEFYKHFGLNMNQEEGKRELPRSPLRRARSFSTSTASKRPRRGR